MPGAKTLKDHETLMTHMAAALGADLDEAELRGEITPEARDGMLFACTGCADPQGCERWLAENPEAATPPAFCRNTDILMALQP